jgi:hypothetical protein
MKCKNEVYCAMAESPIESDFQGETAYYLAAFQHGRWGGHVVWWRPGNAGYTNDLEQAGVYTQSQIESAPSYYDTGDTVPVPVAFVNRMARVRRMVDVGDHGNQIFQSSKSLRTAMGRLPEPKPEHR